MILRLLVAAQAALLTTINAFEVPCTEKLVGGYCNFDEECYGANTICLQNRCSCPTNFEEYQTTDDPPRRFCRPAPDQLNAPCQTDCKPPLTCRDGKCDCWGSGSEYKNGVCHINCPTGTQRYGSQCRRIARLDEICQSDIDCIEPFNECRDTRCRCAVGTRQLGRECKPTCPDGTYPAQSCRRLFTNDVDMMEHKANGDTCADNYYCATYGKPGIGDCCKLYCPYGDPDLSRSCDAGASNNIKCRTLTHFCHRVKGPGYSKSTCCPRPCREPTPLYLNGRCMTLAHLEDLCQQDQQCEGGVTMHCDAQSRRCKCRPGFVMDSSSDRFATCVKQCEPNTQVAVAGRCVPRMQLDQRCYVDEQCPRCARCFMGTCECRCGYRQATGLGGLLGCTNPNARSQAFDLTSIFKGGGLKGIRDLFTGGASCDSPRFLVF